MTSFILLSTYLLLLVHLTILFTGLLRLVGMVGVI